MHSMVGSCIDEKTFHWWETGDKLRGLLEECALTLGPRRDRFVCQDAEGRTVVEFVPPLVQPIGQKIQDVADYLDSLRQALGMQLVILLQAGAASMGSWKDDDLVRHKVIKKYVVRGHGKAQPLYLKTKGKSRYGSRLRLRNARALLVEINEKLQEWWHEQGPHDQVFYSCPVRTLSDWFHTKPPPPFQRDGPLIKIPMDVRMPSFAELKRVRFALTRGRIVYHSF